MLKLIIIHCVYVVVVVVIVVVGVVVRLMRSAVVYQMPLVAATSVTVLMTGKEDTAN